MKNRILSLLRILGTILKYLASSMLALVAVGATGLIVLAWSKGWIPRSERWIYLTLLVLMDAWCIGLIWFLHFRRRVSTAIRCGTAIMLVTFPVGYYYGCTNVWRLQTYQEHRNWLTYESEHFRFHYAPNYPRAREMAAFASARDKACDENCAYLKVSLKGKTDFYVYNKLDEGFAVPDWNVIFADDDQSIGHEMTHIIAYHIAGHQGIKLLDEGIATWLNHTTRTTGHHYVAWEYIQTNGLPPLGELANTRPFRRQRPPPYYPAASFVGYLIENYGVDAFRRLWIASARYPGLYSHADDLRLTKYFPSIPSKRAHFESAVLKVYSRPLSELDTEWRAWLEKRYGGGTLAE